MTLLFNHPLITLSLVSHGQGQLIRKLLTDIRQGLDCNFDIILTLNIVEDEAFIAEFSELPIRVVRNLYPKGFGANHNAAFMVTNSAYFAVINPDVRVVGSLALKPLIDTLRTSNVGAVGPVILNSKGGVEDSARRFPTVWRFIKRVFFRKRCSDYVFQHNPIEVDWLAGMFVIFDRLAYAKVGGFDERYYMYLEDADICLRLKKHGWRTVLHPAIWVIHDAQRASRRSYQHLKWHMASAFRFIFLR